MATSYFYVEAGADDGAVVYPSGFYNDGQNWVGYGPNNSFFRLSNVTIPKGAIIDHAYINVYVYSYDGAGDYKFRIYGVAEDNPSTITSYSDYFARTLTTEYEDWNVTFEDQSWHMSSSHGCPDIKDIIQEIVNRSGWASGNHLMLMAKNNASAKGSVWDYYEDTGYELELEVVYHVNQTVTVPAVINITNTNPIPSFTISSTQEPPVINVNVGTNIPALESNNYLTVSNVINIDNSCPVPSAEGNAVVVQVPVININMGGYDIINDLEPIDIRLRCPEPIVGAFYYPPAYVPPVVIDNSYLYESRFETFKYEILTLQGGAYKSAGYIDNYVESGKVSIDFQRDIIGTLSINIKNNEDINYLSDLVRPWYVINELYSFPMGTFMLMNPNKKSDGKIINRPIQGYDLLLALDQDKTLTSTAYTAGSNIVDLIETLINSVGTWAKYDIVDSTEILAENVNYELGKSKLFIVNSLLNMINYYPLWCDGNGIYRGIPWNENINITHSFIDNQFSLYESGIDMALDYTGLYNRVVIINNQLKEDTAPLYKVWTLEDENLASHPFSYTSIGRYVTKIFQSEAVSQSYVDLRARREILKMLEFEESINYNNVFVPSRPSDGLPWQGDGYRFKNTLLNVDSIYKIESLSIPLSAGGLVNSKIKRIRSMY